MTAEIVIMNKAAVAMAADSAVTMGSGDGTKIYNTVNKLFALSRFQPVGIMIFGNAEFMGLPWETLIKTYRKRLGRSKFDRLQDYSVDFLSFIETAEHLFPPDLQERFVGGQVQSFFMQIRDEIDDAAKALIGAKGSITTAEVEALADTHVRQNAEWVNSFPPISDLPVDYAKNIRSSYRKVISQVKKRVFKDLPMSSSSSARLTRTAYSLFTRQVFPDDISGIVIAGFGESEVFPSFVCQSVEGIALNRLKAREEGGAAIDHQNGASMRAFAQGEMVHTFMEGIDPMLRLRVVDLISTTLGKYHETLANEVAPLATLPTSQRNQAVEQMTTIGDALMNELAEEMQMMSHREFVHPVIDAVAALPLDELATMAETLVNLTSFKRRVSLSLETVGGPIDVAVISKGDGFVWIERKHYFRPELNPQFFATHYGNEDDDD